MRGRILSVGVLLFLSVSLADATPPAWLKQGASFTYHGYGSGSAGNAAVFMTYTVQSAGAGGTSVRRVSTEATYGTPLESKVLSYLPTDQAGDFWLDAAQARTLEAGDTVTIHTEAGYIPATLQARGPLDLGDPQYGLKHYDDILLFTVTGTGSDKATQIDYNYYYDGASGLLISYSEYVKNQEQNLASKVVVYLIETDADLTAAAQTPQAGTAAQANPHTTPPAAAGRQGNSQSASGFCTPALALLLAFSCALAAKAAGF